MAGDKSCPNCAGKMAEGFVVDQARNGAGVSTWQGGHPRKSFWTGIKLLKENQRSIVSWRCAACGFLENYAA